ncbi:MAG: TonB-dependent receptor [Bacteroidales bacterium]|nr:TonB-dependent receptor [Bacteroidales bacterium]
MKKNLFLLLTCLLIAGVGFAQTRVTGKVISSEDGSPAIVSVSVKGTTTGAYTDGEGKYSIMVPSNQSVLVFSGIGYSTVEIPVNGRSVIDVTIAPDALSLDEVVLTAYGPQSKKAFTGTASIVKADEIKNLKVSSVSKALQGLASGVLVVNSNGQPGENATIRIRGIGSFSGSSEPLIVLDGVIYNGNLNSINPSDIESFTVLKDANSTALYGSRAANGVIMITTKIGRPGKTLISASASYGLSTRAVKDYAYLDNGEYMELMWERMYGDNLRSGLVSDTEARQLATNQLTGATVYNPYNVANPVGVDGKIVPGAQLLYQENWNDALFQTGQRQEYNIQVMGGNERSRFMISGGYLDDEGMVKMSKFNRYSIRGKIDANIGKWMTVGLNMGLSYSDQNYPTQGGSSIRNSVLFVRSVASIYPAYVRNRDGSFVLDEGGAKIPDYGRNTVWGSDRPVFAGSNPLGTFQYDDISNSRFLSNNSGFIEIKPIKDITFRTTLGVDYYLLSGKQYYNNLIGDGTAYGGRSFRSRTNSTTIIWTNTLTYDKTFGDHHINVLAGTESYDYKTDYLAAEKRGFDFADQELDYGANLIVASSNRTASRNFRYLGRANYDFSNRYHISASLTYDGTSRFHSSSRWGTFWSVGAGWNIANESFMQGATSFLNTLKLRASYGTSGNQNLGLFPYLATYETGWNILGSLGSIVGTLGNNNLTWEKQEQLDLGIDYALFSNRLTGSVTYYSRQSKDLLMARPLPISAGITSYNDNIGQVKNSGVEIDMRGLILDSKDFSWDLGFNLTLQKNKVTQLPEEQKEGFNAANSKRIQIGYSMYSWYLQEFAGVDPQDGKPMWYRDVKDADGNITGRETVKTYANGTRYMVGDALPYATGGINTNFSWKGISLNIITSFALGGKLLDTDKSGLMSLFSSDRTGYQASKDALKRWQKPGDITDVPYLSGATMGYNSASTHWLVKGDYLRVRSITLGYDLAKINAVKQLGLGSAKIYVSADNPFTLFGSEGLDPEQGLNGVTTNTSSSMKVLSFGLNLEF